MRRLLLLTSLPLLFISFAFAEPPDLSKPIDVTPKPVASDKSVKRDYDIVYVRAPRKGDAVGTNWPEISNPVFMDPGADLMLLHPDGTEEMLVKGGAGSVTDPMVSFDGEWVYYSLFHDMKGGSVSQGPAAGSDIYKIHVKTKKIVRLTQQVFTPNTGAANWSQDFRTPTQGKDYLDYGVFNMGPCPLPGGRIIFASNRNGFKPPKRVPHTLQLFVMDDDGGNVECIGHLNLGMALHPVVLKDGRVMFSSLESQGLRVFDAVGLVEHQPRWHRIGGRWRVRFMPGASPSAWHFQTQLSDGSIVAEEYYNQTSSGFGSLVKFPATCPMGEAFGPGYALDDRNPACASRRAEDGKARVRRLPFSPFGIESITQFARSDEGPSDYANRNSRPPNRGQDTAARVGKVTHPSAAPDNHLLVVWSPGPVNGGYTVHQPAARMAVCTSSRKGRRFTNRPSCCSSRTTPSLMSNGLAHSFRTSAFMALRNRRNSMRSRTTANSRSTCPRGRRSAWSARPASASRESYPNGLVKPNSVTATFAGGTDATGYQDLDPFNSELSGQSLNWFNQGADAGRYTNDDIHAVRILVMEPTTDRKGANSGHTFRSHANERLRILGEIPLRKFANGSEPNDPDGNPDTSFLAKIPADVGFTFQTLDKNGLVLNMAQTWHQVRRGNPQRLRRLSRALTEAD